MRLYTISIATCIILINTSIAESPFSIDFTCPKQIFDASSLECSACDSSSNLSASLDKSSCLLCDTSTNAIFNASTLQCECAANNQYLSDLEDKKICTQCPTDHSLSSISDIGYECVLCKAPKIIDSSADYKCICPSPFISTQSGEGCVSQSNSTFIHSNYDLTISKQISFKNLDSSEIATIQSSNLFEHYFLDSAVNCQIYRDIKACQTLANLCVLTMYNKEHNSCKLFVAISDSIDSISNNIENWKESLPFLYYPNHNDIITSSSLSSISFKLNSKLTLILVKYSMNGTMIGHEEISNELFYFCKDHLNNNDQSKFTKIGYNTDISCNYDLSSIDGDDDMIFYDPYLYIEAENTYFPIPIHVENIDNDDGYKIVRRFFIFDNLASNNEILMYLQSVTFKVNIFNDDKIYPPLIQIRYGLKESNSKNKNVHTSFKAYYSKETDGFKIAIIILFVITLILIILVWVYKIYKYQRIEVNNTITMNMNMNNSDLIWFIRLIVVGFGVSSNFFFFFLFFIASYCYLSFKGQSNIQFLLPQNDDSMIVAFKALLIYCFLAKLIYVLISIWDQCNVDIFFVDWEKPKQQQPQQHNSMTNISEISCWRKLFVANEWNEISIYRNINPSFTFFIFLLFMIGFEYQYLSLEKPTTSGSSQETATTPISMVFKFVISTFFLIIIYVIEYLYYFFLNDRFCSSDPFIDLIDLSSLANISIFIFDTRYHGFYIHGKTIHEHSDTSLEIINTNIENERKDLCKSRGLVPDKDVFEIFVSLQFRQQYDEIYRDVLQYELNLNQEENILLSKQLIESSKLLSMFLCDFIEKSSPHMWEIRELIGFDRFFGGMPNLLMEKNSIFYHDFMSQFKTKLMYIGLQYDLIILSILTFAFVDNVFLDSNNTIISSFIAYIIDYILLKIRSYFGERNVSRKTMIDQKFLL